MSLLNWFSSKKRHEPADSAMPSSGLSRLESTKPAHAANRGSHGSAQPANRKAERMERRELLYTVVRDAMSRAGVLSSSYKFKVLSLDTHGRQFLVMVDLAYGGGGDTSRLAAIVAMVAQNATARHEVLPTAAAMLRLAPALLAASRTVPAAQAWPLYVRDKVAQTTEERAAIKAAAVSQNPA